MTQRGGCSLLLVSALAVCALSACSDATSDQITLGSDLTASGQFAKAGASGGLEPHSDAAERFNWQMNCQGCHHPNGEGNAARGVPPLEKLEAFQTLPEGRKFLIQVPGMARSALSDEELTGLANWMMGEFSSPDAARDWRPYTVDEVAELRAQPIIDGIVETRAALIERISDQQN